METTEKTKVYNLIILDKSGSMSSIASAAIDGFNQTVRGILSAQQQFSATQEHYVSLLPFCECEMDYVYDCVPVAKVQELTMTSYRPCCNTPLYDAMGKGINDLHKKTRDMKNAAVSVTIITDGMENYSREYSGTAIKALVDQMRNDFGWNFAYIGTNQDVEVVAKNLSINNTHFFEDTDTGMKEAWEKERKAKLRMYARMEKAYYSGAVDEPEELRFQRVSGAVGGNRNYQELNEFSHRMTPANIEYLKPGQIFVFGSNAKGLHSGGASRTARRKFGAIMGQGEGLQGQSYAIPTMDGLYQLAEHVRTFINFAQEHPELTFLVTRIGCGIAGHSVAEVAPLFVRAVDIENIWLPAEFWEELI